MNYQTKDSTTLNGWGVDSNSENDPTYPMKHRNNSEQRGYSWERPTQQAVDEEILHSIERPNVTSVFGTSVPLQGLSGAIRRNAFKYSESSYGHWLQLVLADRVNAMEGIVDDLANGHVPNFLEEWGWRAEWKYNRKVMLERMAMGAVVTSLAVAFLYNRKRR